MRTFSAAVIVALAAALAGSAAVAASAAACAATHAETEGPYYKAGAPKRSDIVTPGTQGKALVVTGAVRDTRCKPIANAKLDFWQADGTGTYDNQGYRLRGTTRTDARGRYTLTTVYPGLYPGRTRHIHVKVSAPGGAVVTTQLFFPGVPQNASDGIFDPTTVVKLKRSGTPRRATFTFVVRR